MTKQNKQSRPDRLKSSLPLMQNENVPVFPSIQIKQSYEWIYYAIFIFLLVIVLCFQMLFSVHVVSGHSMDKTLHNNELIVVRRHATIRRFDIVVLTEREHTRGSSKEIVKRVIGLPGDVVTVIDGHLYINDHQYQESYLTSANIKQFRQVNWTIKVPKNEVFVLGDNRDISRDSRTVGCFKKSAIVGVQIFGQN